MFLSAALAVDKNTSEKSTYYHLFRTKTIKRSYKTNDSITFINSDNSSSTNIYLG